MSEKKADWLSDFTEKALKASAEVDIKPRLEIEALGIEWCKDVDILTEPYIVEIPKEKAVGNTNRIWMMDVRFEGVEHQFIAQSGSFRFQLGVLMRKLGLKNRSDLIGKNIKIWKTKAHIDTDAFHGEAEVYNIKLNK